MSAPTRCDRRGHKWKQEERRGYVRDHAWCAADGVTQERQRCRRCGEATEWVEVYRRCYQSITLSARDHETLFRFGELWRT